MSASLGGAISLSKTTKLPSVASQVRAWVDAAPLGSVIDARLAPGAPSNATRVALSRLSSEPCPRIVFVRRNIYWKHEYQPVDFAAYPIDREHLLASVDLRQVARHLAGPGTGYAMWTAGWACGWTRHYPYRFDIAVVGRPPRSFAPSIHFCSRGNKVRKILTWDEATLMEAVLWFVRSEGFDMYYRPDHDWMCDYDPSHEADDCLWRWPDPLTQFTERLLGVPYTIKNYSPDRLLRAARAEACAGKEFLQKVSDTADAVADTQRTTP